MGCASLKERDVAAMVESEWDLRRSPVLQNIDGHVSWSAALFPFCSRFGVYKPSIGVSGTFFLSSTTLSFGIKNGHSGSYGPSGLESRFKRILNIGNVLLAGLQAPKTPYFLLMFYRKGTTANICSQCIAAIRKRA